MVAQNRTWTETAREAFTVGYGLFIGIVVVLATVEIVLYLFGFGFNEEIGKFANLEVAKNHWPAVFVLPLIALFSLFLIFMTKLVSGEIKFKLGGAEISGAASEGLMWILVFISLVWGFSQLWKLDVQQDNGPKASISSKEKP